MDQQNRDNMGPKGALTFPQAQQLRYRPNMGAELLDNDDHKSKTKPLRIHMANGKKFNTIHKRHTQTPQPNLDVGNDDDLKKTRRQIINPQIITPEKSKPCSSQTTLEKIFIYHIDI